MNLSIRIISAMAIGACLGLILNSFPETFWSHQYVVDGVLYVIAKIFIASLKMLVVPLVFVSLVCGVCGLDDIKRLGSLGSKTLALYMGTTCLAISIALSLALLTNPGIGFNLPQEVSFVPKDAPSFKEVLISIVPTNPIKAASEGNMLQIIFFALLFGVGCSVSGQYGKRIAKIFQDIDKVIMKIVSILMAFAPYGVFALIARVFADQGLDAFKIGRAHV